MNVAQGFGRVHDVRLLGPSEDGIGLSGEGLRFRVWGGREV